MEMSILYTVLPFLGATCSGFVLRDIIDYVKNHMNAIVTTENYKANEILLEELPQLLNYPDDYDVPKQRKHIFDFSEISSFDKKKLKSPTESLHVEVETDNNEENNLIKELQMRLKTIRKCTEPFSA